MAGTRRHPLGPQSLAQDPAQRALLKAQPNLLIEVRIRKPEFGAGVRRGPAMQPTHAAANPTAALAQLSTRWAQQSRASADDIAALRQIVARELADLRATSPTVRAWLFGALAWGGFDAQSDIDVAVSGVQPDVEVRLWLRLETATGRAVDLLNLATMPATFAARVTGSGIEL